MELNNKTYFKSESVKDFLACHYYDKILRDKKMFKY
jgi:hypothetical protein